MLFCNLLSILLVVGWGEGGGGISTPLYGLYRYVHPQKVWFSAVLVINRVSILADFGHKWSMVSAL